MSSDFKVQFYNKDFIVIYKPHGYLSEDSSSGESCPYAVRQFLESEGVPCENVYTVHRLDRTTEGLMVYALTKKSAAELSRQITDGFFEKVYTAYITASDELEKSGEMRDLLYFDRQRDKSFVVEKKRAGAKEAVLEYEVLRSFELDEERVSEVRVHLMTGRTHQIRVQFASRKSPLLGDKKYGSRSSHRGPSLFATELRFDFCGKRYEFLCGADEPLIG